VAQKTDAPRHQDLFQTQRARKLRRQSTDAENHLWRNLRGRRLLDLKFRRQVPFGKHYLDFYCAEKKLAIELDGGHHYSTEQHVHDMNRESYLRSQGLKVLRYSDRDVLINMQEVLEDIHWNILKMNPHPDPLLEKEREV